MEPIAIASPLYAIAPRELRNQAGIVPALSCGWGYAWRQDNNEGVWFVYDVAGVHVNGKFCPLTYPCRYDADNDQWVILRDGSIWDSGRQTVASADHDLLSEARTLYYNLCRKNCLKNNPGGERRLSRLVKMAGKRVERREAFRNAAAA